MAKPILNTSPIFAVCDRNDTRVNLPGVNLDPDIDEDNVDVSYNGQPVDVDKARVKGGVLILKMKKISRKGPETGEDEITVTVTNPNPPEQSDPVDVPLVFDE